jgi:hypothetical protein
MLCALVFTGKTILKEDFHVRIFKIDEKRKALIAFANC